MRLPIPALWSVLPIVRASSMIVSGFSEAVWMAYSQQI